jgi:hypothetical protein
MEHNQKSKGKTIGRSKYFSLLLDIAVEIILTGF